MRIATTGAEAKLITALATLPAPKHEMLSAEGAFKMPIADPSIATTRRDPTSSCAFAGRVPQRPANLFAYVQNALAKGDAAADGQAGIAAVFRALGFRAAAGNRLQKGSTKVRLEGFEIGGLDVTRVKLSGRGRKDQVEGVLVAGALMSAAHFDELQSKFEQTIETFIAAADDVTVESLPRNAKDLKTFIAAGRPAKEIEKDESRQREIDDAVLRIQSKLVDLRESGAAPKGVIIYISGPDAVGKTSTGKVILDAFAKAGYAPRRESFKAPTEAERAAPHERFRRGFPNEGEVVFWDRGPAGDVAYGGQDPHDIAQKFAVLERELEGSNVLLVKIELHADPAKQAETLGKRMARKVIAERIEQTLEAHQLLTDDTRASLGQIRDGLDLQDFMAFANYEDIQNRFLSFVHASDPTTWAVQDATKRHGARLALGAHVEAML